MLHSHSNITDTTHICMVANNLGFSLKSLDWFLGLNGRFLGPDSWSMGPNRQPFGQTVGLVAGRSVSRARNSVSWAKWWLSGAKQMVFRAVGPKDRRSLGPYNQSLGQRVVLWPNSCVSEVGLSVSWARQPILGAK